ncbi:MAG: hypothetical protein R3C51_00060 [Parvularculaceae bacterium]
MTRAEVARDDLARGVGECSDKHAMAMRPRAGYEVAARDAERANTGDKFTSSKPDFRHMSPVPLFLWRLRWRREATNRYRVCPAARPLAKSLEDIDFIDKV